MINVSSDFKEQLNNDNRHYLTYADVTLSDGTVLNLTNEHLWNGGLSIDDAVSSDDSFDIGSVIINQCTLTINNIYDDFTEYDFSYAEVELYIGLKLSNGNIEKIRKGVFAVDDPKYNGSIITLNCLDNMRKFDKSYSESTLTYPATLLQIVQDACSKCDMTLQSTSFPHSDFVVDERPNDEALTFREVLSWVGQISCCFCRCDVYGRLELKWFNQSALENPNSNSSSIHQINSNYSIDIGTDDVVITGIKVVEKNYVSGDETSEETGNEENTDEFITYQSGTDGYVISIENNELIKNGAGETVAGWIGEQLIGLRFRNGTVTHSSNPSIEAGDVAILTDRKGVSYNFLISSTKFSTGGSQTSMSSAKSAVRNSAERYSESTKNYVDYRKEVQKERTEREKALEELANRLSKSSGVFTTIEEQEDGSNVYYLHNKPNLSESDIIWKMTAEAWGVSTDGGKTWNAGMTVDGDLIARILTVTGINADWINTGAITVKDDDGNIIFSVDIDAKNVIISGDSVVIRGSSGDSTASEEIKNANDTADKALEEAQKSNSLVVTLSNEYQGIQTDYLGNYTTFPNCQTTVDCYYGSENVNDIVDIEVSEYRLSGEWNAATRTYTVTDLAADDGSVTFNVTYTNLKTTITVSKVFNISKIKGGQDGLDGLQGKDGEDGVSIYDMFVYWTLSDSSTELPTIVNWSTTKPDRPVGKYLWRYDEYHFSNGDVYTSDPYVTTGDEGESGSTSYFHIKYSSVENPTSSSQMTETPAEYIGTYVDYVEDDSTDPSKYTWARFQGLQGETGEQGIPGKDGSNGKTSYLHIKYSNDGGKTFTANNGETAGDYIGQYVDFTVDDSTDPSKYTWSLTKGDDARTYILEASDTVIKLGADNAMTPSSVTFKAFYRDGSSASRTAYSGRFKIEETTNGSTWTTKYTSSSNESSKTYTPSSVNVLNIRCTLYASGGTSTQLDIQTVAILVDVSNIDVVAEINASGDTVKITGNRIIIDSTYFKLAQNGQITCTGAKIVDGTVSIQANSGHDYSVTIDQYGIKMDSGPFIFSGFNDGAGGIIGDSLSDGFTWDIDSILTDAKIEFHQIKSSSSSSTEKYLTITANAIDMKTNGETVFHVRDGERMIIDFAITPTKTGSYGCGLKDYRWSTVYTKDIDSTGAVTMTGVSGGTVQTYATNMYIGTSGRVWKTSNTSSKTIKHDIFPLEDEEICAEKLLDVQVVQAKYNEGILSESDQRYMKNMPMFIIEDLYDKYPIAVDIPDGDIKNASWNERFLLPPMLLLIQKLFKKINEIERDQNEYQSS